MVRGGRYVVGRYVGAMWVMSGRYVTNMLSVCMCSVVGTWWN